jgi:hypothetical protein
MKYKKGDSVKVVKAVLVEGFEATDFVGWQGWVTDTFDSEDVKGGFDVNIEWDSVTLKALSSAYIEQNINDGFDFDSMVLAEDVLEKTSKRDKISDRINVIKDIEAQFNITDEFDEFEDDDDDVFYADLFESKNIDVTPKNLRKYLAYIKENLEMPCILTGIETMGIFAWEEKYDALHKTHPSVNDKYELLSFVENDIDTYKAIRVKVLRLSDKKQFVINLDELTPVDEKGENYAILKPFIIWAVNY